MDSLLSRLLMSGVRGRAGTSIRPRAEELMRSPGMLDHGNESLLTRYRRTARHHRGIRGRTNEKMPVPVNWYFKLTVFDI